MVIISILFDKKKFSKKKAKKYLKEKNLKAIKNVHVTDRYYRYRINDAIKGRSYQTWRMSTPGVLYIIMK